jgi:hypothetical protein
MFASILEQIELSQILEKLPESLTGRGAISGRICFKSFRYR